MKKKFTLLGLIALMLTACSLDTGFVRLEVGAKPTDTPTRIPPTGTAPPTFTPVPTPTQTPVPTLTPTPTSVLTMAIVQEEYLQCGDPRVIDFLVDNYEAMDPVRLNRVVRDGLSHFNYKKSGALAGVDRGGLKEDSVKVGYLRAAVEGLWPPPALRGFHNYEIWYLKNLEAAFYHGGRGDASEAEKYRMWAENYGALVNGSLGSYICGYQIRVP